MAELNTIIDHLKSQPSWLLLLASLGLLTTLKSSHSILNWLYVNFLRPAKNLREYGSWALITGPTDGIGKAFAFHLAKMGLNLILVGRNPDKLKEVSESIKAKHGETCQIMSVEMEFTRDLGDGVSRIKEAIRGLDVGILINNVGMAYPYARFLHEVDEKLMSGLIQVNIEAMTRVTQAVLPGMLERKKGAIVNIGSGSATVVPSDPLYSIYAGAKAYVQTFSRSLYVEYKNSGIDVQCQAPLYVATKMASLASIRKASFTAPSPDSYVQAALRQIGYEPCCTPYWPHSVLWALVRALPESALDAWRLRFGMGIRKRGQLNDARKKA